MKKVSLFIASPDTLFREIPLSGEMGEAQKGCRFRQKKVARRKAA